MYIITLIYLYFLKICLKVVSFDEQKLRILRVRVSRILAKSSIFEWKPILQGVNM